MIKDIVKVIVDRPIGSFHPEYNDIFYTVNYGYIQDVIASDGEAQDAYILGVNVPIDEFVGEVIAIIHRKNDIEDKWVVAPKGVSFSVDEIMNYVLFQEKFFDIEIII